MAIKNMKKLEGVEINKWRITATSDYLQAFMISPGPGNKSIQLNIIIGKLYRLLFQMNKVKCEYILDKSNISSSDNFIKFLKSLPEFK